jgi:hypothetical protein
MSKQFQGSMNYEGISAVGDLKDHLTLVWSHITGFERAQQGLLLAYMYFLEGEYPEADLPIRDYVSASEERYGQYSNQVRCGLILLSNNYIGWGLQGDSQSVLERLKVVSQRCPSFDADPLLEGLYVSAVGCLNADGPTNEQRGFILCLMALSWCVRYASDDHVYTQYAPRLKSIFEAYGFVDDRWEWLVQSCKHNLHDLLGLFSILLEKRLLPSDAQPRLTTEMREEVLTSLLQEFPLHKEGELRERILNTGGRPIELRFTCPLCGSQDLRTKFLEPYYPISTLDSIELDPNGVDLCHLNEWEPSEYEGAGYSDGWEFWCDKCDLVPKLEQFGEDEGSEESLARWLLDNCPQDDGLSAEENSGS